MATTSIAQAEQCPSCGGAMHQRPEAKMTPEQAWCGTWFDCDRPGCWSSILHQSDELQAQLAEQRIAHAKGEVQRLETALAAKPRGRQRERIEVWLQGARVALAIAEEGTDMTTETRYPLYGDNPSGLTPDNCRNVAARMRRALREHYTGYGDLGEEAEIALTDALWDYVAYDAGRIRPNIDGWDMADRWIATAAAYDWRAAHAPDAQV
jgi:hypothetical protein